MALTLSTLTSPTTSGDVLAEMLTTADFLDPVPVLRNIARGPNKGGDAKQTTALNQPKALPVIDGKGYLYLSGVTGNYASVPDVTNLVGLGDFVMEVKDVYITDWAASGSDSLLSIYAAGGESFIFRRTNFSVQGIFLFSGSAPDSAPSFTHGLTGAATVSLRIIRSGAFITMEMDTGAGYITMQTNPSTTETLAGTTGTLEIGSHGLGVNTTSFLGKIGRARIWDNGTASGTPVLDVDFTATNIRHGDTKFKCATGQTVTINQSGTDPATIIKRSVLRFDGADDGLHGLFANNIDSGYMFAAFSVLGDGGENYGRIFSVNNTNSNDFSGTGVSFAMKDSSTAHTNLSSYYNSTLNLKVDLFDDDNGDILHQARIQSGQNLVSVNGDAAVTDSRDTSSVDSDTFNIGSNFGTGENAAIDLYWLGLFPATISDAEAARVVTYINTRNNVFDLKDGFGHYFYDGTKAPVGAISSGSASWNGRIVGSDNGDVDRYLTQATASNQPVSDGYKVTFADNTDFLTIPSTTQAGWQIVGTSLGTFVYRVNANAVTELNLLGNLGSVSYRQAGDLYGIILLPETANGKEIEAARKLLIDRGAADGTTGTNLYQYWRSRYDIVEFKGVNTSGVTTVSNAWRDCSSLTSFPALDMSSVASFNTTWYNCTSLTSFPALDISSGTNFNSAWHTCTALTSFPALDMSSGANFTGAFQNCTALTSFPAGAQLGTAATNVNFTSAWMSSGLTSFPSDIDLSKGTVFTNAWRETDLTSFNTPLPTASNVSASWYICPSLESFSSELPSATDVSYAWYNSTSLSSFTTTDIKNCTNFTGAWQSCTALTSFPAGAKLGTAANNVNFSSAWRSSGLTSFPALDLSNGTNFANAFQESAITTIEAGVLFGTASTSVNFTNIFNRCSSLVTLPVVFDLSKGNDFQAAWFNCSSLVNFPANSFNGLTSVAEAGFVNTWGGCTALSATSVFNILSSIDTSTQSAPSTGPQITIDYNVATGALSAATNTAVTSLKSKGWVIVVNGTTL